MKTTLKNAALFLVVGATAFAAEPKRLLLVTNSIGFRHQSIETTEKVIQQMAAKTGQFTVVTTSDHPDYPDYHIGNGIFGTQLNNGTPAQVTIIRKLNQPTTSPLLPLQAKIQAAREELAAATFKLPRVQRDIDAKAKALADAELAFATARATEFGKLQASDNKLSPQQVQVFLGKSQENPAAPRTAFAPQLGAATPKQQKAIAAANSDPAMVALVTAVTEARAALASAWTDSKPAIAAKTTALATAETNLANARAAEFARVQASAGKFAPAVVKTMVSRFKLPETGNAQTDGAARVFADMLTVENIKKFDGVFFASTVGTLPFPDLDGFISYVRDGGAWLGNHASSDSMHGVTKFFDVMGGEFTGHGSQTREVMTVTDMKNPIGAALGGATFTVHDEMYTFENSNFDYSKVHSILDFTVGLNDGRHTPVGGPGKWPSIWIKTFGKGRVFYSALGHREDVVDPTWGTPATRMNPPEVAQAYQRMLLEGIRYGLGITNLDATPQVTVPTPAGYSK